MNISAREQSGVVIIEPDGKIMGGPEATEMHDRLHEYIAQAKRHVVMDLGRVDWMNSTGLGILISGYTSLRQSGGELKLANVTEKIAHLLEITKLDTIFEIYDSTEAAVQSFR